MLWLCRDYFASLDYTSSVYIDGLAQDCSNSITNALELLQFCSKPSIYDILKVFS